MNTLIESISPRGILVNNGFAGTSYGDVLDTQLVNYADGVIDRNRKLVFSDICFCYITIDTERELSFQITTDTPVIEMLFSLSTNTVFKLEGSLQSHSQKSNQHNMLYYPSGYQNTWQKGRNLEMVSILLTPGFVSKYIPASGAFNQFLKSIEAEKPVYLNAESLPITPAMLVLLFEIIKNDHSKHFLRMHVEATILELLMLQLEQIDFFYSQGKVPSLSHSSFGQMQKAKDFIEIHYQSSITLADVSSQVGTNEYTLKRNFKQAFGKTVHNFLTEKRMNEARRMLLYNDYNVNEVAQILGYNDATNFSAAFKKFFGYTPGKISK